MYLLLCAALITVILFIPVYQVKSINADKPTIKAELTAAKIVSFTEGDAATYQQKTQIFPLALAIILILLTLFDIFLFKNRRQQVILCRFLILLNTGLIVALIFEIENADQLLQGTSSKGSYGLLAILPVISILLYFLAARGIMKDNMLVKSTDRLR